MPASMNLTLAANLFRYLYGQWTAKDGLIALYAKKPHTVEFFSPEAVESAAYAALRLSRKTDVYHLVNLVSPDAIEQIQAGAGRGTEAELESVVALVCEIDTSAGRHKETDYPTQERGLEALRAMPLALGRSSA